MYIIKTKESREQKNILERYSFLQKIIDLPFVESIILYGSRARNDNKERSDIDLAIECPNATDTDWNTVLDIIDNADTLLKIDCIKLDTLSETNQLKKAIQKEGIILYRSRS